MRRLWPALLWSLVSLLGASILPRSAKASPLTLTEVLERLATTHPKAQAAEAKVAEAKGKQLAAAAPFEPTLNGKASANPTGYYEHSLLGIGVSQRIPGTGVSLEGSYRQSRGDIAPYYGEQRTRSGGEVAGKVGVPLLRNLRTDEERAEIAQAKAETKQSVASLQFMNLELARDATNAYFAWVAAGLLLDVANDQVAIAELRARTIEQQAAKGAIARIENVDARRVLLARIDAQLRARAKFFEAQQKLSLYFRDVDLTPILAPLDRVPKSMPRLPEIEVADADVWTKEALARRPEFGVLKAEREAVQASLGLARNDRLPNLDLGLYVARDIGSGDPTLGQTDFGVGVSLKFPIFRRKGRGKEAAARAKLYQLDAETRGLRDRVGAEIRQTLMVAALRGEQAELAEERWRATQQLADAERAKLEQGASDILRVNLREKDVATAAKDAVESQLERNRAIADFHFSVGQPPESKLVPPRNP